MGNKAEYRSAIRSRRLIREALLKLLTEKDLQKITVTDIVKLADINRTTFYAHYPDVRGVMEEIENEIVGAMLEILKELEFYSFFTNPTPLLLKVSRYMEENYDSLKTLIVANGADLFLTRLQDIFSEYMNNDDAIPESIRRSKVFALRVCYFSGGIVNMYKQWFRGTLVCSLNDISVEIGKMIADSSSDMLGS